MSVPRRSTPPVEEDPKTWAQVAFFPLSVIALTFMAAMLLIFIGSIWLFQPEEATHEDHIEPPSMPLAMPMESLGPDRSAPFGPPPQQRPSGGIVIEK